MTFDSAATDRPKTLILMRHAKSDWGDDAISDHDRSLNPRGRRDSPRMARWLKELDLVPDLILCSSAKRTRQTVQLMCEQWDPSPNVSYTEALYLASPDTILKTSKSDGCDADVFMVVAHNPGTAYLACHLADQSLEMPTAAAAIFEIEITDWNQLRPTSPMRMTQWMRPKAL